MASWRAQGAPREVRAGGWGARARASEGNRERLGVFSRRNGTKGMLQRELSTLEAGLPDCRDQRLRGCGHRAARSRRAAGGEADRALQGPEGCARRLRVTSTHSTGHTSAPDASSLLERQRDRVAGSPTGAWHRHQHGRAAEAGGSGHGCRGCGALLQPCSRGNALDKTS